MSDTEIPVLGPSPGTIQVGTKLLAPQKQPPGPLYEFFHKGFQHDRFGEVDVAEYQTLLDALAPSGRNTAAFAAVRLAPDSRPLVNPRCGLATDLIGPDPSSLTMPQPPQVASAEMAAEAVELYWMALLRDVPFAEFHSDAGVAAAAAELTGMEDFRGKGTIGSVTYRNVFRGITTGDLAGPFVSQFLLKDIPYGSLTISQKQQTVVPGVDYMTRYDDWRDIQNGSMQFPEIAFDSERRYIRSMRDLSHYVHVDQLYEAYLNACLILLGINAPVDEGNPYRTPSNQQGFGVFGGPHVLSLVCEVATRALKAVWYQKWFEFRRLRPEAYGGLVHLRLEGVDGICKDYPLHDQVLTSRAVERTRERFGSYLLPMAFPEGSPMHPAYGAGHGTVAGACVTILKAWFDDKAELANPVVATADGRALVPYTGQARLTIGGELDKVAANVAIGRNMGGVHWRSDYLESVKLGEHVALCHLLKQSNDYNEDHTFSLDSLIYGRRITIANGRLTDEEGRRLAHDC